MVGEGARSWLFSKRPIECPTLIRQSVKADGLDQMRPGGRAGLETEESRLWQQRRQAHCGQTDIGTDIENNRIRAKPVERNPGEHVAREIAGTCILEVVFSAPAGEG